MISAKVAADISTKNCKELEKIEQKIINAANRGDRHVIYEKKIDESLENTLMDFGYEVAFKEMDGGFTNETYIRW